jgi:hypothetical protein
MEGMRRLHGWSRSSAVAFGKRGTDEELVGDPKFGRLINN